MNRKLCFGMVSLMLSFAGSAAAAVGNEEAKQLGANLMPWGAEKAGNKDGSIPEFTGERIQIPASYDTKEPGRLPNPWNDKPLFSITAQNMSQYADKLTEGQKALFKAYPAYRMDIYPSRRTAMYPKYVLDNTLKNATSCNTTKDGLQLEGCYDGVAFSIPKTGNQVVWNHTTRYSLYSLTLKNDRSFLVTPQGTPVEQGLFDAWQELPFYDPKRTTPAEPTSLYYQLRLDSQGPTRKVGEKLVFLYSLDNKSRVYQYIPGQRRVKLAPDLAYDTPNPTTGGVATMDDAFGFWGAQDRYDMKLVGKKEIFMPYNAFDMADHKKCPVNVYFTKNFANPDCVRWELHRAWQVDATLKSGFRHIYQKRIMYFDEDTWGAGESDNYDAAGKIYRVVFTGYYPSYQYGHGNLSDNFWVLDLQTGGWVQSAYFATPGSGAIEVPSQNPLIFSPEALAGEGIR